MKLLARCDEARRRAYLPVARRVQLVLTDRSDLSKGKEFHPGAQDVAAGCDLGAKHAFRKAGRGWGGMPRPMIEGDIAANLLIELPKENEARLDGRLIQMYAVHWRDTPPRGPAGRRSLAG